MRVGLFVLSGLLTAACHREAAPPRRPDPALGVPAGMGAPTTGSASFHLDIAGVHERYQDPAGALEHLSKAVALSTDASQRVAALAAVARIKERSGDVDGALAAMERAWTELQRPASASEGSPAGPRDDVLLQLTRLRSAKGQDAEALKLCRRGLAAVREPWRREQLEALEVGLLKKTGAFDARVAEAENALETVPPDEGALRFLVAALGGHGTPAPASVGSPPEAAAQSEKVIRALQRLSELHPEDRQLRRKVQFALEQAGRIDDAARWAQRVGGSAGPECMRLVATADSLAGPAEAARIRARAGQKDKALAEVAQVAAREPQQGVGALLVAADLYREFGDTHRATEVLRKAGTRTRSLADRRQLAYAHERLAQAKGDPAELSALYSEWKGSADPCLRSAAENAVRSASVAEAPARPPPMPSPVLEPPSAVR